MSKIKFKKLDMSSDLDKQILLTYFFKKSETILDKKELLSLSCIHYNTKEKNIHAHTTRVKKELEPYTQKNIEYTSLDDTIQNALENCFTIHEELVCCELKDNDETDYFYIAVIGVDFFMIESELRKKLPN